MNYDAWLAIGREQGFCSAAVCSTHDGIPMSDDEDKEFSEGSDPCVHILRLYESKEIMKQVEPNVPVWRK